MFFHSLFVFQKNYTKQVNYLTTFQLPQVRVRVVSGFSSKSVYFWFSRILQLRAPPPWESCSAASLASPASAGETEECVARGLRQGLGHATRTSLRQEFSPAAGRNQPKKLCLAFLRIYEAHVWVLLESPTYDQ